MAAPGPLAAGEPAGPGPSDPGPTELRLRFACPGPCELYLNGDRVGRSVGRELTPEPMWQSVSSGLALRTGGNVLLAVARADREAWFALEGEVCRADGGGQDLGTAGLWQVLPAPSWRVLDSGPVDELYLADQRPATWPDGRFARGEWEDAAVAQGRPPKNWSPRPAREEEVWAREVVTFGEVDAGGALRFETDPPPMSQSKCVHPEALLQLGRGHALVQTRTPDRAAYLVLDYGRVVSGFPCVRLRAGSGGLVDLGFARTWGRIESGVRYACAAGHQEWTSTRMYSCRYMVLRLSQCAEALELDCVSTLERRIEVEERGAISGSDLLPRIWDTGYHTLAAGRQEVYWPLGRGPGYDWLRAYALALDDYYLSGDGQTAAATLASRRPPDPADVDPVPALAYVLFLAAFQAHVGHSDQVAALIPPALGILAAGREQRDATGLLRPVSERASGTALTALYAGALDAAGGLCAAAGELESAARCQEEVGEVRTALQALWSPRQGLFGEQPPTPAGEDRGRTSRYANALVLYFGLADPEQVKEVADRIARPDGPGADDLLAAFFVAGALWRAGEPARALEWVESRWGRLVDRPGLTWGEKVLSAAPEDALEGATPTGAPDVVRPMDVSRAPVGQGAPGAMGSGAPGASSPESPRVGLELLPGPDYFLGSQVLGVSPGAPGFDVLHIRPQPAGLERAGGRIPTPRGPVQIQWQAEEDRFAFRVDLSEPGETHLFAPRLGQRFPTVGLNGETVWRNEKVHPNPFVQEVISAADHVVLVVRGKGSYEVVVTV